MANQKVGDIIKEISDDVKVLVRDEVELAKSELIPSAKQAGLGAGLFGAAGYFAISALLLLYFAAAYGLVAAGLPTWLGFLIVGGALLVLAALLALIGQTRVKKVKPPERTIASATQTVENVKAAAQGALAAAKAPEIEGEVVDQRALR
jgi:Putative Actinobacterial Holin-X, holin superfamily III